METRNLTKNIMHVHMARPIAMSPSLNYQGGVLFYTLSIDMTLDKTKNDFAIVPMPEDAIQWMEFMARESPKGLVSRDRLENPLH